MCEKGDGTTIDLCIRDLVRSLNDGGYPTVASCCGHGTHMGSVALADGRWLLVVSDAQFRVMDIVIKEVAR